MGFAVPIPMVNLLILLNYVYSFALPELPSTVRTQEKEREG